jgi:hypothetical protein
MTATLGESTDPDAQAEEALAFTESLENALWDLCVVLSKHIADWDWTDIAGYPMEKPYRKPQVFKDLYNDELLYLTKLLQGDSKGQRKNGSRPSGTISLPEGQGQPPETSQ